MKKKSNSTHDIAALKQEIVSLREGLQKTAGKLAECMVELEDERTKSREYYNEVGRLNTELIKQGQYQTRAHETIELLVKKMPYAQKPATQFVVTNQVDDSMLRGLREKLYRCAGGERK